jgi:hypothetical protein
LYEHPKYSLVTKFTPWVNDAEPYREIPIPRISIVYLSKHMWSAQFGWKENTRLEARNRLGSKRGEAVYIYWDMLENIREIWVLINISVPF